MKRGSWIGLAAALGLWGCGCERPERPAEPAGRAVTVELEGVVVRQYRGAEQRFELRADRLALDEDDEVLEARGGVSGVLAPGLWREQTR